MESKLPLGGGPVYGARGEEGEVKGWDGTEFERIEYTWGGEGEKEKESGEAEGLLTDSRLAKLHR